MIRCDSAYIREMAIHSFAVGCEVVWKKAEDGENNGREEALVEEDRWIFRSIDASCCQLGSTNIELKERCCYKNRQEPLDQPY